MATTPTLVQVGGAFKNGVDPYTHAFASACTPGTLLVAVLTHRTSGDRTLNSVSDPTNGTWTQAVSIASTGANANNEQVHIYYVVNTASTALTVTADWSGAAVGDIILYELASVDTSDPVDVTGTDNDASVQTTAGVCANPAVNTAANVYIIAGAVWFGGSTTTNYSPPFTRDYYSSGTQGMSMSYGSDAAVTGEDGSFTRGTTAAGVGALVSFNGAPAANPIAGPQVIWIRG